MNLLNGIIAHSKNSLFAMQEWLTVVVWWYWLIQTHSSRNEAVDEQSEATEVQPETVHGIPFRTTGNSICAGLRSACWGSGSVDFSRLLPVTDLLPSNELCSFKFPIVLCELCFVLHFHSFIVPLAVLFVDLVHSILLFTLRLSRPSCNQVVSDCFWNIKLTYLLTY